MKITFELTDEQFAILSYTMGNIVGMLIKEAAECSKNDMASGRFKERAQQIERIFHLIQAGVEKT